MKYIKYGDEGKVTYLTNNLMTGFMDRADHCRKYVLGNHAVLGDEPKLEIEAVWFWHAPDMLPLMHDHI